LTQYEPFDADLSMDQIIRLWPGTIRVLFRHKVLCVGCPLARFHTAVDACNEHCLNEAAFVDELKDVAREDRNTHR
jgi:hybrid cluster-associated redox disulfide protein